MEHTQGCLEMEARVKAQQAKYEQEHPKYCRVCKGWGGRKTSYDPSPAGVSLSPGSYDDFEDCPACIAKGNCPACGKEYPKYIDEETGEEGDYIVENACTGCGFILEETPGRQPDLECLCYLELEGVDFEDAGFTWEGDL